MRIRSQIVVPTLGLEEETFVVDRITGEPRVISPSMWAELIRSIGEENIAPEYKGCQLELRTGKHDNAEDLRTELAALRFEANAILAKDGLCLLATSTHPTADWRVMPAREGARYRWIERAKGDSVHRLMVNGVHVHVGTFENQEERVFRIPYYRRIVPMLIAASAASPFFDGRYTGHQAYRRQILTGLSTQTPPSFESAEAYSSYLRVMAEMGVIQQESDIWGDVRLGTKNKPTVEMRCMETSTCVDDGPAIAALLQAYDLHLRRRAPAWDTCGELPKLMSDVSAWRAAQQGGQAVVWDFELNAPDTIQAIATRLIETLGDEIETLQVRPWIEHFEGMVAGRTTAAWMLEAVGSPSQAESVAPFMLDAVVQTAIARTALPPGLMWPPAHFASLLAA